MITDKTAIISRCLEIKILRCHSNINNFRVPDQNSFQVSWSYLKARKIHQFVTTKDFLAWYLKFLETRTTILYSNFQGLLQEAIPEILCTWLCPSSGLQCIGSHPDQSRQCLRYATSHPFSCRHHHHHSSNLSRSKFLLTQIYIQMNIEEKYGINNMKYSQSNNTTARSKETKLS